MFASMNPQITIIVPMHNEELGINEFFSRIIPILEGIGTFEIICINDGSIDKTALLLAQKSAADSRVKAINFSRNFGKEAALTCGIDCASGNAVIPIDADLQDPPELIPEMVAKWQEGYKVVLATRKTRSESWFKRKSASLFYAIISRLSNVKIPKNTGDFRLMDRQVVDAIKQLPERTRFMKGLFAWAGFNTATIYYDRPQRFAGKTSWNYLKLWSFALDGIFAFSTKPLKIWAYLGGVISLFAFIYGAAILLKTLIYGSDLPGYASIMVVILFLGGIQLVSLGIIGEYVGRIYRETKHRPLYLIESKTGFEK